MYPGSPYGLAQHHLYAHLSRLRNVLDLPDNAPEITAEVTDHGNLIFTLHQEDGDRLCLYPEHRERYVVALCDAVHQVRLGRYVILSHADALSCARDWWEIKDRARRNFVWVETVARKYTAEVGISPDIPVAVSLFQREPGGHTYPARKQRPNRDDGRFEAAGHVEPYPGAWPVEAVFAATEHGDLTALWPYLGEQA